MISGSTKNAFLSFCFLLVFLPEFAWADERTEGTPSIAAGTASLPPKGRSLTDWLWKDQIKATLEKADDEGNLWVLVGTAAATALAHEEDADFRDRYGDNKGMSQEQCEYGAILGSGGPGIALALGQIYFDTDNGLQHARALGFTSLSHITIALAVQRERPNGKNLSFPSGHTSSAFATATSLAYSYGPWVGIPALAVATYIGLSRPANNAHWLSDVVAGAGLGIFWARASSMVGRQSQLAKFYPSYVPTENGAAFGIGYKTTF